MSYPSELVTLVSGANNMGYLTIFIFLLLVVLYRAINSAVGGATQNAIERFFGVHTEQSKAVTVLKTKAQIEQSAYDKIEASYKKDSE